jgi:TolB-like protein/DNA-binding winged helix-turn-helix (wHTH) protein
MSEERIKLFDEFTLDMARGCVLRSGQEVHLRPQAYEVLKYLVEHRGHLISKDRLIDEVWQGRAVTDGSLGKCIEEIRDALGENSKNYVRNVRGRGYIFDTDVVNAEAFAAIVRTEELETVSVVIEHEDVSDEPEVTTRTALPSAGLVPHKGSKQISRWLKAALTVSGLLVIGVVAVIAYRYLARDSSGPASIRSIAVLPFVNESGNSDLEYLADGMTDTLINNLSKLPNLTVKARGSVFRFKGTTVEPQQVAATLSVQAVLQGRVVQRGDDLTLYLALVNGLNGDQLWGEQYSRKMADLQALQNEIARDVSHKLRARLSGDDERRIAQDYTANTEAYQLYLRGRFHFEKFTPHDQRKSITYFQQAIALDPNFAAAYAYLAGGYSYLAGKQDFPRDETVLKAKEYALKAISLDERLSTAHEVFGSLLQRYDFDFTAAEREYKRAIELDPNNASAYESYGGLLTNLGRHDEALAEARRAAEINPLSASISSSIGFALVLARRYDEGIAQLQKALELDAYFIQTHYALSIAYQMQRNYAESVEERAKITEILGDHQGARFIRDSFAAGGWRGFLKEMTENSRAPQAPPYIKATLYVELGEKE